MQSNCLNLKCKFKNLLEVNKDTSDHSRQMDLKDKVDLVQIHACEGSLKTHGTAFAVCPLFVLK